MEKDKTINPAKAVEFGNSEANITTKDYQQKYLKSIEDPENFWKEESERLSWIKSPTIIKNTSYSKNNLHVKWFEDGELNVCYNCVDRHLATKADKTAIIWEGDDPDESKRITYRELHKNVCRFANILKSFGLTKGDSVTLYMPMIEEAAYAMLACTRLGIIHSIVFGGFSSQALAKRIVTVRSSLVITAEVGMRGKKEIPLKKNVDDAISSIYNSDDKAKFKDTPIKVLLITKEGNKPNLVADQDYDYKTLFDKASEECSYEVMKAEDPLFVLFTSGSTGAPKGVLHTSGGYLLYASLTHKYLFDYKDEDVYWCTADVGWITGHSYVIYGPLANGATTLMFEGVPNFPDYSRFWQVCDKHKVTIFYTAPTAIRAIMREGDDLVKTTSRKSLRVLGTVGEPINPNVWLWYYDVVGGKRCPIVDTWWQTETGGILISSLPFNDRLKPGSAGKPFLGISPTIIGSDGNEIDGEGEGVLCVRDSWPGQMRSIYGDHDRFIKTYFSDYENLYFSGDGVKRDKDGYYWITGRVDDVLNVSGHRLGTAEIESALILHPSCAEAAVVGFPHHIKGVGIYCFVTLQADSEESEELRKELIAKVRDVLGPVATPDVIQFAPALPKTRSGKIMRRILRKIAKGDIDDFGDISTLADTSVIDHLIKNKITVSL